MSILLVCNGHKLNETYRLIRIGYPDSTIEAFSTVTAAMNHIKNRQEHIDICFVEILMNDLPGFGFVEKLRSLNRRAKVVLIAPDDRFALDGWRYGMNDYLIEPLSPESISHTVISCAAEGV